MHLDWKRPLFCLILGGALSASPLLVSPLLAAADEDAAKQGYTINYDAVSIVEYIKFASKICNVNFIFNEEDLPFTVSVVSDAPITPENVMATLAQTLRIHNLSLLEQGNNVVIHKNAAIRQMAELVFEDGKKTSHAAIVTRVFRLKSVKPDSLAAIIRPMISQEALIEVLPETHQLIVTDISASVDKVAILIENLDSPQTHLEIKSYDTKFNSPQALGALAAQLMTPLAQGNPFTITPQPLAGKLFIVSTPELNEKALSVLASLDVPPTKEALDAINRRTDVLILKLEHRQGGEVLEGLHDLVNKFDASGARDPVLDETIASAKWVKETNTLMFVGTPASNERVKELVSALDTQSSASASFFVYKPRFKTSEQLVESLKNMADDLAKRKDPSDPLIGVLRNAAANPSTQTVLFSGDPSLFPKIKELLATVDLESGDGAYGNYFLYKIQTASPDEIQHSLKQFAATLKASGIETGVAKSLEGMKYIQETNSLLFTGSQDVLKRLQDLVPQFDKGMVASNQFLIYKPKVKKGEQLVQALKDTTENLQGSHFTDPALLRSLESLKWVKNTNSIIFTGDPATLKKVEDILASLDAHAAPKPGSEQGFFLYRPQYATRPNTERYLKQVTDNLNKQTDADLIATIRTMKWIEPSQSFMFSGSEASLDRIKALLASFDTASEGPSKPSYFIYKVQNTTGDAIEDDVDHLLKNMRASGLQEDPFVHVLETLRYVKETNSILLSGPPAAVDQAKDLLAKYDYPRKATTGPSNFFMYKPQHANAPSIEKSLKDVGSNLKKADLADPQLLSAIETMKYVDTTNSLIFTGSQDTIQKIQGLLKEIDIPLSKHVVGKTTFLLYKLKHASGPQITASLKNVAADLKKSGTSDKDLLVALNSMKFVRETNSLMFTGTEDALGKVQLLLDRFDVAGLGQPTHDAGIKATQFYVYRPQALQPQDLEKTLLDFADNLQSSGLQDPPLFQTIHSMKFIEKTQSLVFTGNDASLAKVKELLKEFDVSTNLPEGAADTQIQAIDNTSFLVYKLQFHKGDEIQGALRQIAKDLTMANAPVNQNLLNSINSIQWLEVTNSLLCSGDQETLTRLRELIKNLDIPLKQVFIEVLVIETTMANATTFGLNWSGKFNYKNKFSASTGNFSSSQVDGSGAQNTFPTNFSTINATTKPNPSMIPFSQGFDLGVIGDIVMHKGQSFLSLGSLLNALEIDGETTIVMTPKILGQDSKTSSIFVGQNVPYAGSFISNSTAGATTISTSNLEYRDIGFNLTITPVLGNSDIITLDLSIDSSSQVSGDASGASGGSTFTFSAGSATGITTSRTTMQTTVHIPDRHFLILSGWVNNTNKKTTTGLPCLGGIPAIGAAFTENSLNEAYTSIVIFLRPTIINSLEDMKKLATDQESFFHDQMSTPYLEHNFEEGMEYIKSPADE